MFTRVGKWIPLAAVGLFPLVVGCDGGSFSLAYHDDRPVRRVYVDPGPVHICTHGCHHHYWDGGRLVVLSGHRHGPGCGHVFKSNRWLVVGKSPAVHHRNSPRVHPRKAPAVQVRKGPAVHVQKAPKRVKKAKHVHVHGPGCGHVRVNGKWIKRR